MAARVAWVALEALQVLEALELLGPTVQHRVPLVVLAATVEPAVMAAQVEKADWGAWPPAMARPGRMAMAAPVVSAVLRAQQAMAETVLPEMPPRPMVVPGVPGVRQVRQAWVVLGVQPVARVQAPVPRARQALQSPHLVDTAVTAVRGTHQSLRAVRLATAVQVAEVAPMATAEVAVLVETALPEQQAPWAAMAPTVVAAATVVLVALAARSPAMAATLALLATVERAVQVERVSQVSMPQRLA